MDSTSGPKPQQPQQPQQPPSGLQQVGDQIAQAMVAGLTAAAANPEAELARDLRREARMIQLIQQEREQQTPQHLQK